VKLPKLAKEPRLAVVDLFGIFSKLGMFVVLNVPKTVRQTTAAGTSDFLLLRSPVRKLDLVREQDTTGHDMNKSKLGFNGTDTLLGDGADRLFPDNLDPEKVVGVTLETLVPICRDLVLPVRLRDGGPFIVRVEATECRGVVQTENRAILDILRFRQVVPSKGSIDGLTIGAEGLGLVLEKPNVVVVFVRVESNLLLLAASGVHERMRVQVTTLGIDVTNGNAAAHHDISGDILGGLAVESSLEFGAHEAVAFAGVSQAHKVDGKHGKVKGGGNDNEAEDAGHEVLGQETNGDVLVVPKQNPELDQSQGTNPGDGEETNPLDTGSDTETEASHGEPEPPSDTECLGGAEFVLVGEAVEGQGSEGGRGDKGRVEENQTGLSEKAIF
jgi:hypothetical protein